MTVAFGGLSERLPGPLCSPGPLRTCQHPTVRGRRAATISPLRTAKRRWITTTLELRYTFSALNGAVVRCSSASAGCLYRWAWSLRKDFSLCLKSVYCMSRVEERTEHREGYSCLGDQILVSYYPTYCYISWPVTVVVGKPWHIDGLSCK